MSTTTKLPETRARCQALHLRMILAWSSLVVVALFLGACATPKPPPAAVVLPSTGPNAELVRKTPVVDIHTHTFNARFLPVRNLLLGKRRDKHWAATLLVRPPFVISVANKIARYTKLENRPSDSATEPQPLDDAEEANELSAELERPERTVTAAELQKDPSVTGIEKIAEGRPGEELSDAQLKRLGMFVSMLAPEEQAPVDKTKRKSEIGHFLKCLMASDGQLVDKFYKDHGEKRVELMVSHMMDLAPVFNQEVDRHRFLLPFGEQIARFKRQQDNARGRMLYFVAYNPFRDHYRGGGTGDALKVVKDAYEKQGAFGVKVYPPAGYRPFANQIPAAPRRPKWTQAWKQWNARYQPGGVRLSGKELDERLLELFYWAVKHDVPLFVHTGDNEVEASKDYAEMANPARWRELLDAHKELENIRICFGHAGDSDYWFGQKREGWGEAVFELCAKYPNIYCEFGVHDSIVYPDNRQNFSARLAELIAESRADSKKFDFSTKILYGSDWFMPMMAGRDRVNYLNAHKEAILQVPLKPVEGEPNPVDTESLYKNYFYRNAMAFLNAEKQLTRGGIPGPLRAKLRKLVEQAGTEHSDSRKRGAGLKLRALTDAGKRKSQEDVAALAR